ncbi:bifunctional nuclease family protein [bacterium]|nr:bifunctional nuclease family protein [bacterium]
MIVSVKVERVTLDTSNNRFVVILRDEINDRWLPIVVGPAEAQAIAFELERVVPPRPMTHDLIRNLLSSLNVKIAKVVVSDLRENTYYATIGLKQNGSENEIDARPSDAIALALRTKAPIFVEEQVMEQAAISEEMTQTEPVNQMDEINQLNVELQKAIEEERYEDAAKLRDLINEKSTETKKSPKEGRN